MYTSLEGGNNNGDGGFLDRYKKPIVFLISVASIVGIICIIVFALLHHVGRPSDDIPKYPFTPDQIFNNSLFPKTFNLKWDPSGESYIYQNTATKDWYRFSLVGNSSALLINVTKLAEAVPNYYGLTFSPDGNHVLVAYNYTKVWRHSYLASYAVYTISTGTVHPLVPGSPQLQNVVWNPANSFVAFVLGDNIYVTDAVTAGTPTAVTSDGDAEDGILNGIQSWVYEEEIFSDYSALWWSADGKSLAYLRFDEQAVPIFEYTIYNGGAYPTQVPLRYPKAGYTNPSADLHVYDLANGTSLAFEKLSYGPGNEWEYIASINWSPDGSLWVQQLNRYQNITSIQRLSNFGEFWLNEQVYHRTTSKWVDIFPITFYPGYNLAVLPNGDNYHFGNIQKTGNAWEVSFLTSGTFDVISLAGYGSDGRIYYHATPPVDPQNPVGATLQYVYYYDPVAKNSTKVGNGYGVYSATFSPRGDFFVYRYLGPKIPQVFLVATNATHNHTLEDNKKYADIIEHYDIPVKTHITVKGAGGEMLNAYHKIPLNEQTHGLPLIVTVYAGPGTQRCRQTHDAAGLDAYLSAKGYLLASIDGRGTGRRGLSFLQQTYRQLGLLEIADQRAGAKDLLHKVDLIDSDRVGIWGWSYGGFMASHGIAGTASIQGFKFRSAVAVAPVTNWAYYDSVYTERFMSTPADNPSGYNETSVLQHAVNTPDDSFLLMHGTGDDNVHFQNSVELANVLIQSNVEFDSVFFPNSDHSINNGNSLPYLYEKLLEFFEDTL